MAAGRHGRDGLRARLRGRPSVQGAASIAVATGVAQAIALCISPILTRLYSPADFGALGLYVAVLALVTAVASLRYEVAIPLTEDDDSALSLLFLCVALVVGMACLLGVAVLFIELTAYHPSWMSGLEGNLWLFPVGVTALGLYQCLSFWTIRQQAYRTLAATKLTQGVALGVTQVGIGAISSGPLGLLLGDLAGRSAGVLRLSRSLPRRIRRSGRRALGLIRASARRFWRFPVFSSGATLMNVASLNLPPLLMVVIYGPKVGGLFVLAQRVTTLPVTLIGDAVSQVYLGRAAELARSSRLPDVHVLFTRTSRVLVVIAAPAAAVIAVLGPDLFAAIFGEEWRRAGTFAQLLVVVFLTRFVVYPLSQTLNVLELQHRQAFWDGVRFLGVVGVFAYAELRGASEEWTVGAYSAVLGLSYVAIYVSSRRALLAGIR